MIGAFPTKIIAALFILLILVFATSPMCEAEHLKQSNSVGVSQFEQIVFAADLHAPHATDFQSHPCGPCHSCTTCSCHAPISQSTSMPSRVPVVLVAAAHYPFQYLPEVYLSFFVPPQNIS